MNSLEAEYSFLAPTWKLPSLGAPSTHPHTYGTTYSSSAPKSGPDMSTWNNTMHNTRYVPPTTKRQTHQQPVGRSIPADRPQSNNDDLNFTININQNDQHTQPRNNSYSHQQTDNRAFNYPQPVQKRVQIIDPNRRTPSTDYLSGRESQNSYSPESHHSLQKSKPHMDDNKSDSSIQRPTNFKVHEYLYGLAAPDPGSYVNAYKNQRRREEEERYNRNKSNMTQYKNFVQNGGFGPAFGNYNYQTREEKLDTEKKRKSYSNTVRETNQYKIEEQKRLQNNGGPQRNRTNGASMPKLRRPDAVRSHFISAQETNNYIEKPDYNRPRSRSGISSRLFTISPIPPSTPRRFSNSPALRQSTFNDLHPWNQSDILSGEFYVERTRRSSSISSYSPIPTPTGRRVRFHSRDFIRRRSSTFVDLPIQTMDTNHSRRIESASARSTSQKSTAKILEEKDQLLRRNLEPNHHSSSTLNIKEEKFITLHSMMNNDIQSPPTAMLEIINQPYKSENRIMTTTSTNNIKKPILVIRSPEDLSKTTSRNVRFVPEIIDDDDQGTNTLTTSSTNSNRQYNNSTLPNTKTDD